jgi:hypothetical protein
MLLHGWVQAVDCTSFQAKMSSQNSGHGCLNLVMRERTYAETRMWNMCNLFGERCTRMIIFVRLACLAGANFLPPARPTIRLQNLFA